MTTLDTLSNKSDDDLFADIGHALLGEDAGMGTPTKGEAVEAGKGWLTRNKEMLCSAICNHPTVINAFETGREKQDFVALVVDVLDHHLTKISPVPPASTGLLFVRLGYYTLCPKYQANRII